MGKLIYVITIILISADIQVNSLQCYTCTDCAKVNDSFLLTCEDLLITTTSNPVTTGGTATTLLPTTTGEPSNSTSSQTASSTPPTVSTEVPPSNSTTSPTATTPTTIPNTTATEAPPTNNTGNETTRFEATRVRRAVLNPPQSRAVTYVCATVHGTVNNVAIIGRGCLVDQGDDAKTCAPLNVTGAVSSCKTCKTDKCNGAVSIQVSSALLFVASALYILTCK